MQRYLILFFLLPLGIQAQNFDILSPKIDVVELYRSTALKSCEDAENKNNAQIYQICICSAHTTADKIKSDDRLVEFLTRMLNKEGGSEDNQDDRELRDEFNKILVNAGRRCIPNM